MSRPIEEFPRKIPLGCHGNRPSFIQRETEDNLFILHQTDSLERYKQTTDRSSLDYFVQINVIQSGKVWRLKLVASWWHHTTLKQQKVRVINVTLMLTFFFNISFLSCTLAASVLVMVLIFEINIDIRQNCSKTDNSVTCSMYLSFLC